MQASVLGHGFNALTALPTGVPNQLYVSHPNRRIYDLKLLCSCNADKIENLAQFILKLGLDLKSLARAAKNMGIKTNPSR